MRLIHAAVAGEGEIIESMSDLKTMPAALSELLRPRQMARVRRTVARSRAEGALFDALLWSGFTVVALLVLVTVANFVESPVLDAWAVDSTWLVAGALLIALFVAGALWWRWFKWHLYAADLARRSPDSR